MVPMESGARKTFSGRDLPANSLEKVVSELGISHVPEGRRLFGNPTVLENLKPATFARKDKPRIEPDPQQVFAIFNRLEERKHQKAGTLSGGQMPATGRAFMSGPKGGINRIKRPLCP
jgi:branched-chain amino acid transport system ATP-binding protein